MVLLLLFTGYNFPMHWCEDIENLNSCSYPMGGIFTVMKMRQMMPSELCESAGVFSLINNIAGVHSLQIYVSAKVEPL